MIHDLKTLPEFFEAILREAKTFEVRVDDRNYAVGDTLILRQWHPDGYYCRRDGTPATKDRGAWLRRRVTYKMNGGRFGIAEGWCVLGIAKEGSDLLAALPPELDRLKALQEEEGDTDGVDPQQ